MYTRIVVCVDLPTDDPAEAYRMLNEILVTKETENIGWETTDEWYDSDGPLSQEVIDAACAAYDPEGGAAVLDG
jgi:hypothetical protein